MNAADIFISHATADKAVVTGIRKALEGQDLTVWVDSRELTGGDDLDDTVLKDIEQACWANAARRPGGCARVS